MRDEKRIDRICNLLKKEWKKVPDWRFFQLVCNIQRYIGNSDCFYVEDDDFEKALVEYFGGDGGDEEETVKEPPRVLSNISDEQLVHILTLISTGYGMSQCRSSVRVLATEAWNRGIDLSTYMESSAYSALTDILNGGSHQ